MRRAPLSGLVGVCTGTFQARLTLVVVGIGLLFVAWSEFTPAGPAVRMLVSNGLQMLAAAFSGFLCLRRGRRYGEAGGTAWVLLGLGSTSYLVGQSIWTWIEVSHGEVEFPSVADVLFLVAAGCYVAGMLAHLRGPGVVWGRVRLFSEGTVLALAAFVVLWPLVLRGTVAAGSGLTFSSALSLAYPMSDLVMIALALLLLGGGSGRTTLSVVSLAFGFLLLAGADTALAVEVANNSYASGAATDVGWIVGTALIGLASLGASERFERPTRRSGRRAAWVATVAIAASVVSVSVVVAGDHRVDDVTVVALVLLLGLTTIQKLAFTVEEQVVSEELERRVAERTYELGSLTDRLAIAAHVDQLTGLANRRQLQQWLEELRTPRPGSGAWLALIDLDNFKAVNDSDGHLVGDDVLRIVAERLGRAVGQRGRVARLGGDEFAVVVISSDDAAPPADLCDAVVDSLSHPLVLGSAWYQVGASIGLAEITPADPSLALRDADIAMYEAKRTGRSRWCRFEPQFLSDAVRRASMSHEIRQGVENDEFVLYFQPIVRMSDAAVVGAEALVRWRHPRLGLLQPADFIDDAYASGAIVPLGAWVVRRACETLRTWQDRGLCRDGFVMSVNVATAQLAEAGYVEELAGVALDCGIDPTSLQIEIIESAELAETEAVLSRLLGVHELGVNVAIDDFGTGYSSFGYLQRGCFDVIKLDRSLVPSGPDADGWAIIEAMITVARTLGIGVVAEGVESAEQATRLAALGCEKAQGFYFARPAASDEFAERLLEDRQNAAAVGVDSDRERGGR